MSFWVKWTKAEKPGSAAEVEVRPPNIAWFRIHVRLPKVVWPATYKRAKGRWKEAISPPLAARGEFQPLSRWLSWFLWFPSNLSKVLRVLMIFEGFKQKEQSLKLGEFENGFLSISTLGSCNLLFRRGKYRSWTFFVDFWRFYDVCMGSMHV